MEKAIKTDHFIPTYTVCVPRLYKFLMNMINGSQVIQNVSAATPRLRLICSSCIGDIIYFTHWLRIGDSAFFHLNRISQ